MSISQPNDSPSLFQTTEGASPEMDFLQGFERNDDPVEAYFECITQCSLDDGECVTVCTTILREQA